MYSAILPVILDKFWCERCSRYANHIVGLLDKWSICGHVKKDDVSVVAMLGNATLAQIMEYIDLAVENHCTNVTTELLNYKNERFLNLDPLAEFTLDGFGME